MTTSDASVVENYSRLQESRSLLNKVYWPLLLGGVTLAVLAANDVLNVVPNLADIHPDSWIFYETSLSALIFASLAGLLLRDYVRLRTYRKSDPSGMTMTSIMIDKGE